LLRLWSKVIAFLAKIFGVGTIPPEVANSDTLITSYWDIYAAKAPWIPYSFVTADGIHRKRNRLTLNPAKIVCAELAGLVLSEPPAVDAGDLVAQVIQDEKFFGNLRRYTEYQAALGGQAIKARVEDGNIKLDFVTALNVIPIASDNRAVTEASFIDRRTNGKDSFVRVETYRRIPGGYRVTSQAFDEKTQLEVPMDTLWPGILPSVDIAIDEAPFVYIANPEANNIDPESPLGISIFANATDTLQGLDIAYDSMKTEIIMGKQRVALPGIVMRKYLDQDSGTYKLGFDPSDEAYIRLESDDADNLKPTDLSGQLRMEQWRQAIQIYLEMLAMQTGFDAGYFSFDGKSMKTATEVISENSHTYKTVSAYRDVLNDGLMHLFRVINKLGKLYGIDGADSGVPMITWDDGIIEDRNTRTKYHEDLYAAGLEDRITAIKAIHGLDDAKAQAMAEAIKADKAVVTDPFGIGG